MDNCAASLTRWYMGQVPWVRIPTPNSYVQYNLSGETTVTVTCLIGPHTPHAEGAAFQLIWTCRRPVMRTIFMAPRMVFQDRFYCIKTGSIKLVESVLKFLIYLYNKNNVEILEYKKRMF